VHLINASPLTPTGTEGNAAGPTATHSTGASEISVIRQRQIAGGIGPAHHHDREEVLIILSGTVAVHAEDASHTADPGDAVIIPANLVHRVETTGEAPAEWLLVAPAGVGFFGADGERIFPAWAE